MTNTVKNRRRPTLLALVVPCYNEEAVLSKTAKILLQKLLDLMERGLCHESSFIVFVDDGSEDSTWEIILSEARDKDARIHGVRLAVNAGHQNALMAGIEYAYGKADCCISIDADLQDDPNAIEWMLEEYQKGAEIVLGVRKSRNVDSIFKRWSANWYYRISRLLGVNLVDNHADYRLLSNVAMKNLLEFREYHLFLRGLQKKIHGRISCVYYARRRREQGESKYTLRKMLSLAWNGITSMSVAPLRLIGLIGAMIFLGSFCLSIYAFVQTLSGITVPGWASITIPLYLLGGVMLLSLAIIAEYIGKIYIEVKRRPRYLIDEIVSPSSK